MKKSKVNPKPKPHVGHSDGAIMQCPYDMLHFARAKKMASHLAKCRRNWMESEVDSPLLLTCRFNCFHRLPAPEIIFHEKTCRDRNVITTHMIEFNTRCQENPEVLIKRHALYTTLGKPFVEKQEDLTPEPNRYSKIVMRLNSEVDPTIVAASTTRTSSDQMKLFPFRKTNGEKRIVEMKEERAARQGVNDFLQGSSARLFGLNCVTVPRAIALGEEDDIDLEVKMPDCEYDEDWEKDGPKTLLFDGMKGFETDILLKYPANMSKKDRKQWRAANVNKARDLYGGELESPEPTAQVILELEWK